MDKTASAHKWGKKAAEQLKKLNKGFGGQPQNSRWYTCDVAHNVDTKVGLVNGAIGTVRAVSASHVIVQFDHISEPYDMESVMSRFMIMRKYCVYRKQFPLILGYAVTIHKCQGLSLDYVIVNLSNKCSV